MTREIRALRSEVIALNSHKFVRAHDSWLGLILFQLVRGLAFGLGSVIGATLLIALLVSFLQQIDFIPVIGNWATEVLEIIQAPR
ncbi:hypothetical protein GCM10007939_20170 [Amylibacter marinus]|uniref:Uncharacterized protein n=2 Tax=Amylibacter marinus TaxID=1475483 RepID=A0ABQ5VX64_9RHOB|nr:hypothetical protein GCM10007939_20170 [Amylibacter marinus]